MLPGEAHWGIYLTTILKHLRSSLHARDWRGMLLCFQEKLALSSIGQLSIEPIRKLPHLPQSRAMHSADWLVLGSFMDALLPSLLEGISECKNQVGKFWVFKKIKVLNNEDHASTIKTKWRVHLTVIEGTTISVLSRKLCIHFGILSLPLYLYTCISQCTTLTTQIALIRMSTAFSK